MIRCKIYTREEQTFKFIKSKKKNFVFFSPVFIQFSYHYSSSEKSKLWKTQAESSEALDDDDDS